MEEWFDKAERELSESLEIGEITEAEYKTGLRDLRSEMREVEGECSALHYRQMIG